MWVWGRQRRGCDPWTAHRCGERAAKRGGEARAVWARPAASGLGFSIRSAHTTWGHLPSLDSVSLSHCPAGPSRGGASGELTGTSVYSPQS